MDLTPHSHSIQSTKLGKIDLLFICKQKQGYKAALLDEQTRTSGVLDEGVIKWIQISASDVTISKFVKLVHYCEYRCHSWKMQNSHIFLV